MNKPSQSLTIHITDCINYTTNKTFGSLLPYDNYENENKLKECRNAIANNWKARMSFQKLILAERVKYDSGIISREELKTNNKKHLETYIRPSVMDHDVFVVAVVDRTDPIIVIDIFYDGIKYESLSGITAKGEIVRDIVTWLPLALTK